MSQFKVDLHTHTNASSDGRSTLQSMIKSAGKKGIDAILVSDHNVFSLERSQVSDGILLIAGCEISTSSGHILALFCKPFDFSSIAKVNGLPSAEHIIDAIHENGGIAIAAHPFENPMRNIDEIAKKLDGIETANARVYMKNKRGNEMARAFANAHELFETGGSDAHHESELGNCFTLVEASSIGEIEEAIRKGRTAAVEERKTKRTAKGLSQMESAFRSKKIKRLFKASLVLTKGIFLDTIGI